MSKSREQINQFLGGINIEGKRVLDVGVQNNPASNYVKGIAKEYLTTDVDEEWGSDYLFDLNKDFKKSIIKGGKKFDVVFCLEVLEHCWNPVQAIWNLFDLVDEGGVCYISVPFINPIHDKWDYLRYTPEWFEKVLPMVGFKGFKIHLRRASIGTEDLMRFYQGEGLRMSKIREVMGDGHLKNLIGVIVEAGK